MSGSVTAIVLAAGKGTRMKSALPKVMHEICGQPMLGHILDMLEAAGLDQIIVVAGHGADMVADFCAGRARIALQTEQLGTGHAVMCAVPLLEDGEGTLLVMPGDAPLLTSATVKNLCRRQMASDADLVMLSAVLEDAGAYGRVLRTDNGLVRGVVEARDASPEERDVKEINAAVYAFKAASLLRALGRIDSDNAQGEYYLTDTVALLAGSGRVLAEIVPDPDEVMGINDRVQLAAAGELMRRRILEGFMRDGVTIIDPSSTFIDNRVVIAADTVVHPFTILEGRCLIGAECHIGPHAVLTDTQVGDRSIISNSVVRGSVLEDNVSVGPYASIRPGTYLHAGARAGGFVELKNAEVGARSAVPHLSYIGDSFLGEEVNIGAGTVTCNFDGRRKSRTVIGDKAFIGSGTKLIAPVTVGEGAVTGAGSVINRDVPPWKVAVGMPARVIKERDWGKGQDEDR